MINETKNPPIIPEEIAKKGEEIYQKKFKNQLEPKENGKYIAIEIDSKKHFIGETKEEALDMAQKTFPKRIFFVRRIGELEKISSIYFLNPMPTN